MDYSLLVGMHDCAQAEEEALLNENTVREAARETSESEECESGDRYLCVESQITITIMANIQSHINIACILFRCTYNTPPDSPRCLGQYNDIVQDIDIYALHSIEGKKPFSSIAIIDKWEVLIYIKQYE